MRLRSIEEAGNLSGKRVLLRAGFDFGLAKGKVPDDFRMRAIVPTMKFVLEQGGSLVVIAHEGRPNGVVVEAMSLKPIASALGALLGVPIVFIPSSSGSSVYATAKNLQPGEVLLLENLRFDSREEANDAEFARELAALGDLYVNEAFPNTHRLHASIVGVATLLPSYAGLHLIREIAALEQALTPKHPALAIMSGIKLETKMPVISKLLATYDNLCIGGALANDLLKARGYEVGVSLTSDELPSKEFAAHPKLLIPTDVVAETNEHARETPVGGVKLDERIMDIGPMTLAVWQEKIAAAQFILWNGPLGIYEKGYRETTKRIARAIVESGARAIVGGGNTIASLSHEDIDTERVFLSTGGGAMLEFLANGTLPGLEPLQVA